MIYVTANQRFFHKNVIQYESRPFASVDEMNAVLLSYWNETVTPDDIVYCLGNVSFGPSKPTVDLVQRLHGNKLLIMGDHDYAKSSTFWKRCGFVEVHKTPIVLTERNIVLSHHPIPYLRRDFINVHGSECRYPGTGQNYICVGVQHTDYRPVQLDDISRYRMQ